MMNELIRLTDKLVAKKITKIILKDHPTAYTFTTDDAVIIRHHKINGEVKLDHGSQLRSALRFIKNFKFNFILPISPPLKGFSKLNIKKSKYPPLIYFNHKIILAQEQALFTAPISPKTLILNFEDLREILCSEKY